MENQNKPKKFPLHPLDASIVWGLLAIGMLSTYLGGLFNGRSISKPNEGYRDSAYDNRAIVMYNNGAKTRAYVFVEQADGTIKSVEQYDKEQADALANSQKEQMKTLKEKLAQEKAAILERFNQRKNSLENKAQSQ